MIRIPGYVIYQVGKAIQNVAKAVSNEYQEYKDITDNNIHSDSSKPKEPVPIKPSPKPMPRQKSEREEKINRGVAIFMIIVFLIYALIILDALSRVN